MLFEWDEKKNISNIKKHGISFEEASQVFNDPHRETVIDNRKDYKELREMIIGKALISKIPLMLTVVITEKSQSYRIISARKANYKEIHTYYGYNS
jgi:uncharacterized protein